MSNLSIELGNVLLACFELGQMPSRKFIVDTIKATSPGLVAANLELEVATYLNHLVDVGTLQRTTGRKGQRFYAPGEKYDRVSD